MGAAAAQAVAAGAGRAHDCPSPLPSARAPDRAARRALVSSTSRRRSARRCRTSRRSPRADADAGPRAAEAIGMPIARHRAVPEGASAQTVPEVAERAARAASSRSRRSCSPPPRPTASTSAGRDQAIVCGIEAHVCVNQTVLDLLDSGVEVHVAERRGRLALREAEPRARAATRPSGAGAVLTSVETALFELLRRAGDDEFKSRPEARPGVRAVSAAADTSCSRTAPASTASSRRRRRPARSPARSSSTPR